MEDEGMAHRSTFHESIHGTFARTGTTLVSSGVPLLQMLSITGKAVNNVHIERAIMRAADKVKGGKSLADSIDNDLHFLPLVPNMVRIGEQSGSIEQMLAKGSRLL
ncbi:type II secretion system F family protein [Candidatus Saccharibacteria bacterium]|nr:MAG: type II secretion system F family protein [Candidatus Saccharibacteria bacterium]